ncbi:hypothetical protein AeMF1_008347 [Aphanomyces euteiches]|nr:hypothetical protein AeMF1_016620 [Aphanomyces euteiches]KAH9118572.1 hypothetical protein AeMF1_008347 [Aphanomyces euteiches]
METLLKQITRYDVHAPWSEQLQALADIKAVVEQVLQVDSRDAVVDTLTILTEPSKLTAGSNRSTPTSSTERVDSSTVSRPRAALPWASLSTI